MTWVRDPGKRETATCLVYDSQINKKTNRAKSGKDVFQYTSKKTGDVGKKETKKSSEAQKAKQWYLVWFKPHVKSFYGNDKSHQNMILCSHHALILPSLTCVVITTNKLQSGNDTLIKLKLPFGKKDSIGRCCPATKKKTAAKNEPEARMKAQGDTAMGRVLHWGRHVDHVAESASAGQKSLFSKANI